MDLTEESITKHPQEELNPPKEPNPMASKRSESNEGPEELAGEEGSTGGDHIDYCHIETPNGLKIHLGSRDYSTYQLGELAIQLKDIFNGSEKKTNPHYT